MRVAFRHAVDQAGGGVAGAARWMGVAESTVRRWLAGTHPVLTEAVVESRRLRRHFATCLAVLVGREARGGRARG